MDTQSLTETASSASLSAGSPVSTGYNGSIPATASRMQLGFVDPVDNAQQCFRALLNAFGQPAIPVELKLLLPDFGLPTSAIATVLALTDVDTTLWLSPGLPDSLRAYFRFHTGVRIVDQPAAATFAFAHSVDMLPLLNEFNPGTALSPETSTTVIVPVKDFVSGFRVTLDGPGFEAPRNFSPAGFDEAFWEQLATNQQRFPAGIDLVLCCETQVVGLPRSTQILTQRPTQTLNAPLGSAHDITNGANPTSISTESTTVNRVTRTPLLDAAKSSSTAPTNTQEN
jgi:alpha-D-ribose 1-methylphosphonate 5-triphosphate synthase subunit PhnH